MTQKNKFSIYIIIICVFSFCTQKRVYQKDRGKVDGHVEVIKIGELTKDSTYAKLDVTVYHKALDEPICYARVQVSNNEKEYITDTSGKVIVFLKPGKYAIRTYTGETDLETDSILFRGGTITKINFYLGYTWIR